MTTSPDVGAVGFTPGRLNIVMVPGQAWSLPLEWNDATSTPMNLTGYTARVEWSDIPPRSTPPPLPSVQLGSGSPNMVLSLSAVQTTGVAFRAIGWSLHVQDPGGTELPWLEGVVTLYGTGR